MSKKEQFLAFVLVGAMAQDVSTESNDCPLIMHIACQIYKKNAGFPTT